MKTLNLTVLLHEGPMARAYLAVLEHAGYRPGRIVNLLYSRSAASGKKIGGWLPGGMRRALIAKHQDASHNHWARHVRSKYPVLAESIMETVGREYDLPGEIFERMIEPANYGRYADEVQEIPLDGFKDPALSRLLAGIAPGAVLYTGGGIVPRSVLEVEGIRILHVHPGCLPHVRGADGLLWSMLVRGRPGASCFYMAPGIDTGDVIAVRDFSPLAFAGGAGVELPMLYRALYSLYDPILRSVLFCEVVKMGDDLMQLPGTAQDVSEGVTYHFMNDALRQKALERLFAE